MNVLFLLLACAPEPAEDRDATCGAVDDKQGGVFYWLDFAERVDGVSTGFDLDGRDSDAGDDEGCGQIDLVGPDGTPGIDNAFSAMIPALEVTEAAALDGLIQDAINSGELLLMYDVQRLDSLADDDCVDVDLFRASGEPMVGSTGWLVPSQTFDMQDGTAISRVEGASITDGALEAGPFEFNLPINILDAELDLTLTGTQARLEFDEEGGAAGYIGGGISAEELIGQLEPYGIDPDLKEVAFGLIRALADLNPDDEGVCQDLSVVLEFEATPAFVFED